MRSDGAGLYERLKPWLFRLDAETAHEEAAGLLALLAPIPGAAAALRPLVGWKPKGLAREVFGVRFPNPVGLAAGFDKDGRLAPALAGLGFGFVEVGSVTLEPQPGNPRPRLFRRPEEGALVNRMGFNSAGAREVARTLAQHPPMDIPLGINLGLNKGVPAKDAPSQYARCFRLLMPFGSYFVVNVSSPNTPGLRDLQKTKDLSHILDAVQSANSRSKPVLVKLSPDMAAEDFEAAVAVADASAQGLVVCNTTIKHDAGAGGLSGRPLKARALELTRRARAATRLPIVGVGGVETAADARERLAAGADLVQLYTGLVYGGPCAVRRVLQALEAS